VNDQILFKVLLSTINFIRDYFCFFNDAELKIFTTEKNNNHFINMRELQNLINNIEMNSEVILIRKT